jgi:hypothetical protein
MAFKAVEQDGILFNNPLFAAVEQDGILFNNLLFTANVGKKR